ATKADKLSRAQRQKQVLAICRGLQVQPWEVIPFSSEDGTGMEKVLEVFDHACAEFAEEEE
ncbi:MAG: YihA family ribosome biogenesis GTP-binding protein, partial [Oscillospiraceae bacterium]|nr:YihA family ribosome biogenesis GTP-binding protein [Oscillospiraceae bacterium]